MCSPSQGLPSVLFTKTQGYVRAVDNFVVPSGALWTVSNVLVMGEWIGPVPTEPLTFTVSIFNRGFFVSSSFAKVDPSAITQTTNNLDITLTLENPFVLVGAHTEDKIITTSDESYYLTVAAHVDYLHLSNSFYWSFSESGDDTMFWKDEFNILQRNCRKWTSPKDCGFTVTGSGMCFKVVGTTQSLPPDSYDLAYRVSLPNGGDGIVGSDGGHHSLLTLEEAKMKKKQRDHVAGGHTKHHHTKLAGLASDQVAPLTGQGNAGGMQIDVSTPWVVALIGMVCVIGFLVVVLVVIVFKMRFG